MNFAFGLLVLVYGSLAAIAYQLRHAPKAFEDATGFHFSSPRGDRLSGLVHPRGAVANLRAALFQALSRRRGVSDSIRTVLRTREAH
jgi:hypothetical protein